MKKTPIISVKLQNEEQEGVTFRRGIDNIVRFGDVYQVSKISTKFEEPYVIASCYIVDKTDGKKKLITFYRNKGNKKSWGTEIYVGPNYVEPFNSNERSWSKNYRKNNLLPDKYKTISKVLENVNRTTGDFFEV